MRNKLEDLRNHLFAALEGLSDTERPMELERAKAIAEVSQVIINSAKLEIDVLKLYDGTMRGTEFVPLTHTHEVQPPSRPQLRMNA